MSTLRIKKIYIDTKYMTPDSESTSNFKVQLANTIDLPDNCSFMIQNICIPHSWYTIEEGLNDKLYFHCAATIGGFSGVFQPICTLTAGIYNPISLASLIQTQMNNATASSGTSNIFSVVYNATTNTINISVNYPTTTLKILTPNDLKTKLNGSFFQSYDVNNPHDCNELISNLTSATYDLNHPFIGVVNLQPVRNIYIHSSTLGTFQTIGVQGENTCIKKVPVNVDVGYYIYYDEFLYNDVLDCSKQCFSVLEFQLRDSRGNLINLHNNNMSFSICFVKQDDNI